MGEVKQIEKVPVDRLIPYINNAKIHTEEQVTKIASCIREFGFLSPALIDKDNNIIAGHGRVMAAKRRMSKAECVRKEDREETPAQILRGAIVRFFARFDLYNTDGLPGSKHDAVNGILPDFVFSHGSDLLIVRDCHV